MILKHECEFLPVRVIFYVKETKAPLLVPLDLGDFAQLNIKLGLYLKKKFKKLVQSFE